MKALYQALRSRVMTVPSIRYCDWLNGQLQAETYPGFDTPAVMIEVTRIDWQPSHGNYQKGKTTIRFHIAQQSLADSYATQDTEHNERLAQFDLVAEVHKVLQGYAVPGSFTPLERSQSNNDHNFDNQSVHILEYETLITECIA